MNSPQSKAENPHKNKEFLDALANGLAVLRLFASGVAVLTIQDVADRLGVTRAGARRLLLTLLDLGYLVQRKREFSVTPKVLDLGLAYFASMKLPALARPAMRALADEAGLTCSLGVFDNGSVVFIAREEPPLILRLDLSVGSRLPAYAHSIGRILLSALDDDELNRYLEAADLKKLTPFTVTSKALLRKDIVQTRRLGYCMVISELVDGLGGISVPLHDPSGRVIASMGISMVLGSRPAEEALMVHLPALRQAVGIIEELLVGVGA